MANGEILRGEVYWINTTDAIGGEEKAFRPGVVISSDYGNTNYPTVTIAFTTTQQKSGVVYPYIRATGNTTWVLCNQIRTIDKSRLDKYMGMCTDSEMAAIERGVRIVLDIGYRDLEDDLQSVNNERDEYKNLLEQRNVEVQILRKQYDMVLNQLVEMKVAADIASRMVVPEAEPEEPVVVEFEPDPEPELEPGNEESEPELEDEKVELSALEQEKVNINTATSAEMAEKLGIPLKDAYSIAGHRKKHGLFTEVEELILVDRISPAKYEAIKDRVIVGVVEEEPELPKVNINTASVKVLTDLGFRKQTAMHIIHNRKNRGPFRSVDDLENVDTMDRKLLKKLRDRLEV